MKYKDLDDLREKLYKTGEKKDFVHLHLHSDFSLKDGIGKPTQYAKKAIEIGMSAVAITDHGSIGAHPSFFMFCRSNNLKPIVGVEAYLQNRRKEVKLLEEQIKNIEAEIKVLKSSIRYKRPNKKTIEANIECFKLALNQPDITFEQIAEMDYSEVKEYIRDRLHELENQSAEMSKDRETLRRNQHILLLAKNETGRKHITKVVSNAAREGFYYKPRTAFDFLEEHKEGMIVSSACLAGPINSAIREFEDDEEAAIEAGIPVVNEYKRAFGDDFYIEVMPIDIERQKKSNKILIEIAKRTNVKWIVTNDVHYLDFSGATAQEISLMLGSKDETGDQVTMRDKKRRSIIAEMLNQIGEDTSAKHIRSVYNDFAELDKFEEFKPDPNYKNKYTITLEEVQDIATGKKTFKKVWEFSTKDFWFKDRHQLIDTYIEQEHYKYIDPDDFVIGLDNTLEVEKKIDSWNWDTKEKLPKIEFESGKNSYEHMVEMVREGWQRKAEDHWYEPDSEYTKRVKYELSVVRRTEMADYFVIVADYIRWAKQNGVLVGAGRGSAAGSLVCYLLDITNIEPIQHGLLFERFLSMSRSMAIYDLSVKDIDIKEEDLNPLSFDEDDFDEWYENERIINFGE